MKNFKALLGTLAILLGVASVSQLSHGTLSNLNTQTVTALGNGVTTNYTIGFVFQDNDELRVYLRDESTTPATITLKTEGVGATKYTVTGGDPGTTVVMGTAPTSTQRVVIKRTTAKTQPVDYDPTQAFPALDHEEQMDRFAQITQELGASVATKIGYADGTTQTAPPTFPEPSASGIIGWNSAGTNLENKTQASLISGGGGLSAANNLSDVASITSSVSNLGLPAAASIYSAGGTDVAIADGGTGASTATLGFNALDPLTTKGDLVCHDGTNSTRLGAGTNNFILTADSTEACGVKWAANAASVTGTANYVAIYSGLGALSEEATLAKSRGGTGADNSSVTFPATGTIVTRDATETLTNKTIDADSNTLSNIENADIKAAAAIAVNKLAAQTASRALVSDGSGFVSPATTTATEIGYVNGVTSAIQTQLDAKASGTQYPSIAGLTGAAYANAGVLGVEVALDDSRGGTGFSTYSQGDILYASAANTLAKLPKGSAGQALKMNAAATLPEWGAAGGSGGINFVGLDSSWIPANTNDINADASVGNWLAYADAAATSPVDMTGGSPNTTCVRNSTGASTLNGTGSLEMVLSSAGSRQGEGCAVLTYVPVAYRGQTVTFTFPFKLAGINVEDDIRVFAYDVTNSELITPYTSSKIVGTSGQLQASFATKTTTAQMRVGLHIARTSTGQLSVLFDDVSVGPGSVPKGLAGGNWTAYTPTFTGFGTVTSPQFFYRRVGDSIDIRGNFTIGTATATEQRISFPFTSADTGKISAIRMTGHWTYNAAAASTDVDRQILIEPSVGYITFSCINTTTGGLTKTTADTCYPASSGIVSVVANDIPIAGFDANVSMAESSQFKISSYLANGSRVTGAAPTLLGQYRSYLRNGGANTFTETNGAPTATPSEANGIRYYTGNTWDAADSNSKPSKYEIFVGKNKSVRSIWYASAGRTGVVSTAPFNPTASLSVGVHESYDPTTGIYTLVGNRYTSDSTDAYAAGISETGGGSVADPYFDLVVSENAVSVGMQMPRCQSVYTVGAGYGSTDSKVRRIETVVAGSTFGTCVNYATSSTAGSTWTLAEPGVYSACYSDVRAAGAFTLGISRNSTELTTNIQSITSAHILAVTDGTGAGRAQACATFAGSAGDVIRPHGESVLSDTTSSVRFSITKVSN